MCWCQRSDIPVVIDNVLKITEKTGGWQAMPCFSLDGVFGDGVHYDREAGTGGGLAEVVWVGGGCIKRVERIGDGEVVAAAAVQLEGLDGVVVRVG